MNSDKPLLISKICAFVLLIFIIGLTLESASYVGERYLVRKGIIYEPPKLLDEKSFVKSDPLLGWPSPHLFGKGEYDSSGSRITPSFPQANAQACASAYGDSFTWGYGVNSEFAWPNLLSEILGCRVTNFGVSGYGTDQSYLRFRLNGRDNAKIVILGHLAENIVRNVNQLHFLLYRARGYGLKPRFLVDADGSLKLIPLPRLSYDEYRTLLREPENFLLHEYFLPGGPGTSKGGFPHTFSLLRAFNNYRLRAMLTSKSHWADFYRKDHPSRALEITTIIIESFYRHAQLAGRVPIVVVYPLSLDLIDYQKTSVWVYQPLLDNLHANGIDVLNIGESVAAYLGQRNPCDLFTTCKNGGHFNEEGNAVVAKIVAEYLVRKNLLTSPPLTVPSWK